MSQTRASFIGCSFAIAWILSALIGLATSVGILGLVLAGLYYLCTGEFICR